MQNDVTVKDDSIKYRHKVENTTISMQGKWKNGLNKKVYLNW